MTGKLGLRILRFKKHSELCRCLFFEELAKDRMKVDAIGMKTERAD